MNEKKAPVVICPSMTLYPPMMITAAAANGWVDGRAAALESLTCIRRAGADIVLTYWAADAARWLS